MDCTNSHSSVDAVVVAVVVAVAAVVVSYQNGKTALMLACGEGHKEVVEVLLTRALAHCRVNAATKVVRELPVPVLHCSDVVAVLCMLLASVCQ